MLLPPKSLREFQKSYGLNACEEIKSGRDSHHVRIQTALGRLFSVPIFSGKTHYRETYKAHNWVDEPHDFEDYEGLESWLLRKTTDAALFSAKHPKFAIQPRLRGWNTIEFDYESHTPGLLLLHDCHIFEQKFGDGHASLLYVRRGKREYQISNSLTNLSRTVRILVNKDLEKKSLDVMVFRGDKNLGFVPVPY